MERDVSYNDIESLEVEKQYIFQNGIAYAKQLFCEAQIKLLAWIRNMIHK